MHVKYIAVEKYIEHIKMLGKGNIKLGDNATESKNAYIH